MSRSAAAGVAALALVWLVVAPGDARAETGARFEVILRNGMILDGTGARSYRADVGIASGVIARIGDLRGERAAADLDVGGLFVAPGVINLHSHSAAGALPRAENLLTQGVTTVILNSDGRGPADIAGQKAQLGLGGLAVNVGAYIGFNGVWQSVVGLRDRRPTAEEIDRMRSLIVRGMEHGAWGVSAGLGYAPAYYARTDEVVRVVGAAARWRTNFPNHERILPEAHFGSKTGIMETLAIAERAGLVAVVTHMKATGVDRGNAAAIIERMNDATTRGHYTAADAYPYLAGQGWLGELLIPRWAQEGGRAEMRGRFASPALRARIVAETERDLKAGLGGPESVYLSASKQELAEVMRQDGVSAGEAVVRVVERGNVPAILRFGVESDLVEILRNPTTSIACDCDATTSALAHPRYYGTFPRVLGRYVREQKVLTWEDAIRKMTALPANTVGLVDRGVLAVGMAGDVAVFDPKTISDRATFEDPTRSSEGIRHVIVNGRVALREGRVTGEQGGRVLERTIHMPSRAMSADRTRRTSARPGTLGARPGQEEAADHRVEFDVRQKAGAHKAEGSFRVTDLRSTTMIQSTDLGVLQTADRWAAFTGRARFSFSPEEKAITVIVEQSDPLVPGRATINVSGGGSSLRIVLDPRDVEVSAGGR